MHTERSQFPRIETLRRNFSGNENQGEETQTATGDLLSSVCVTLRIRKSSDAQRGANPHIFVWFIRSFAKFSQQISDKNLQLFQQGSRQGATLKLTRALFLRNLPLQETVLLETDLLGFDQTFTCLEGRKIPKSSFF